jgi:hypothetical protein
MGQSTREIQQQQDSLLEEMGRIRVMRRGTVSRQQYRERRARKEGKGASGPYFMWQGYREGKHFSQRMSARQAQRMQQEIEARKQFERLCAEYVKLGETLAQCYAARMGASEEAQKKGLKPRRKPAGK